MARAIQIRRGNSSENNDFTGLPGEVTMDMESRTLRLHDGETVGGISLAKLEDIPEFPDLSDIDYVVESTPKGSKNWYRKYKSGWVEIGGTTEGGKSDYTINLPFRMYDTEYFVSAIMVSDNSSQNIVCSYSKTYGSVRFLGNASGYICWEAKGFTAE
jgi:hypothetical protein